MDSKQVNFTLTAKAEALAKEAGYEQFDDGVVHCYNEIGAYVEGYLAASKEQDERVGPLIKAARSLVTLAKIKASTYSPIAEAHYAHACVHLDELLTDWERGE